jgi:ribonuclease III
MKTKSAPSRRRPTAQPPSNSPPGLALLLGHAFSNPRLLELALTHRSLSYETDPGQLADPRSDNEQLEFLGDAVLGLVIAESLYRRFPNSREGELTRLRASLVSRKHLGETALRLALGDHLRLGKGEDRSGGRAKPALLANALEAVIAALYLDGGLPAAAAFIERHILLPALPTLNLALADSDTSSHTFSGAVGDHKSALQELLQATGAGQPEYVLTQESGPDHRKRFLVEVRATPPSGTSTALAQAEGATKKEAQQQAARLALLSLIAAPSPTSEPAPQSGPEPILASAPRGGQ